MAMMANEPPMSRTAHQTGVYRLPGSLLTSEMTLAMITSNDEIRISSDVRRLVDRWRPLSKSLMYRPIPRGRRTRNTPMAPSRTRR